MKNFTIDNETNSITIHSTAKEAEAIANSERFSSEGALAKLAASWPASRLVEIFNRLPGESPVRKFKDRATAVSRIWKAIQTLAPTEAMPESTLPGDGCSAPDLLAEAIVEPTEQPAEESERPATLDVTTTEPAVATTVAPQGADVAPAEPGRLRRPAAKKRHPLPRPRKKLAHRVRAARPVRLSRC